MFKNKLRVSSCVTVLLLMLSLMWANLDRVYMKLCPDEYNFMLGYVETSVSDLKVVSKDMDEYYDSFLNYFQQNRNPWTWVTLICDIETDKLGISNSQFFLRAMSEGKDEEVSFTRYSNEELETFVNSDYSLRTKLFQQDGWMSIYFNKLKDSGEVFNESLMSDATTANIEYIDNYVAVLDDVQLSAWNMAMMYFYILVILRVLAIVGVLVTIVLLIKRIKSNRGVKNGLTTNEY